MRVPPGVTFQNLAQQFMVLVAERYPNSAKVLQILPKFGIDNNIEAKIIVLTQMRNAVKQMPLKIYNSVQHRDELYTSIIEALENLEDALEEEENRLAEEENK